jgi:N-methylhydantoinase A
MGHRIGVDIGGTFTDAVALDDAGNIRTAKALTTPGRLHEGVLDAVSALAVAWDEIDSFVHGTTAGLNAFLERRGARVALLTTGGFRDVYELGRASRPEMYDVRYRPPTPLVPRRDVHEVTERLDAAGEVVLPLDTAALGVLVDGLDARIEAVAICFLHAYENPRHEREAARIVLERRPDVAVVCSSDIAPEWREYERTSTTVLSAYVAPIVDLYLRELDERLVAEGLRTPLRVMQSNGGIMTATAARSKPVQTLFSGPVGGTIAGVAVAEDLAGEVEDAQRLICIDMGGTSFDVSLVVDGAADVEAESSIEGHPIIAPTVAIHTIGAGGGSVAHVAGGGLRVGPRSAGADPGPASYGTGGLEPTVTDANLLLGRLPSVARLGGSLSLDRAAAETAMEEVAEPLGLSSRDLAAGVVAVADAAMANAIREITVRRGIDPRDFSLVAFGGAGPLHAVALAEELELPRVIVPADPGVLSAYGMLRSDARHDAVRSYFQRVDDVNPDHLDATFEALREQARLLLKEDGIDAEAIAFEPSADLRYSGQEYTVSVPIPADRRPEETLAVIAEEFAAAHHARYGHNNPGEAVEFVNLRVAAFGRVTHPDRRILEEGATPVPLAVEAVRFDDQWHDAAIYRRDDLPRGAVLVGPVVVLEDACTSLVPPSWEATVSRHGHLVLERSRM